MFNDLNNSNKSGGAAVDDIFAETDKTNAKSANAANVAGGLNGAAMRSGQAPISANQTNSANTEIETQKIGLTADNSEEETGAKSGGKWFRLVLIVIVIAIVVLGAYLVYVKFLATGGAVVTPSLVLPATTSNSTSTSTSPVIAATSTGSTNNVVIPGVNAPVATTTAPVLTAASSASASLIDSDNDGLSDAEEASLGTNPNATDTDGDGLSDYEEVKIYHTDPLNPDSDGDGYSDGLEVKGGYNPLGAGKLSDLNTAAPMIPAQ